MDQESWARGYHAGNAAVILRMEKMLEHVKKLAQENPESNYEHSAIIALSILLDKKVKIP